jgi:hypothetical protein
MKPSIRSAPRSVTGAPVGALSLKRESPFVHRGSKTASRPSVPRLSPTASSLYDESNRYSFLSLPFLIIILFLKDFVKYFSQNSKMQILTDQAKNGIALPSAVEYLIKI